MAEDAAGKSENQNRTFIVGLSEIFYSLRAKKLTKEQDMSYTSFSIGSTGRAWDGIEAGTDAWSALQAKQMQILADAGAETIVGGWATGIGKFININTYPDIESSKRVIARLAAAQLFEVESSGPFIPTEEIMTLMT